MTNAYQAWIKEHYPTPASAKLQCETATTLMINVFPELCRVRGYAFVGCYTRPHWWCVTKDGEIIDPTVIQYESKPAFYEEIPLEAEEPHGKCYECGALLFRSKGDDSYYCAECE